ncbi:MAG TPA: methyltransferase, FxLD system [Micromonospora sp.]
MRCLEIGSGGYHAALMAELVGPGGQVTTVDIDADIVQRARQFLAAAGYPHVRVVHADAAGGVPQYAPYDRIIVTAAAWDVPPAWWQQLTDDGVLVVPLRIRGLNRSIALVKDGDRLVSLSHKQAGFVPMQGADAYPERRIPLAGNDIILWFDEDDAPDVDGEVLRAALHQPRVERWSGVQIGGIEPFDGLLLWLATRIDRFGLITTNRSDSAYRLVKVASYLETPTVVEEDSFAYLALRPLNSERRRFEYGACGHGPHGEELASELVELVRAWDRDHRYGSPARIQITPANVPVEADPDARVIRKRHTTVTISWPAYPYW